jgi:hypothetical protein
MTSTLMKKADELTCPASEDLIALLKYQIRLLPSKETSRPELLEMVRLLESLKIVIQARLGKLAK